jgi:UDP-galactopyranose mutase
MNKFAYPLNTIEKPEIMKELLGWAKTRKVYGLGRWGEWQHYNSDAVVELAMKLADELTK